MPNFQVLTPAKGDDHWIVVEEGVGNNPSRTILTKAVQVIRDCECLTDPDTGIPYIYITGCTLEKHESFVTLKPIVKFQT